MPLRVRLQGAQGVCISLDSEAAILLRDALYDDADSQSSTHAEALISELLTGQGMHASRSSRKRSPPTSCVASIASRSCTAYRRRSMNCAPTSSALRRTHRRASLAEAGAARRATPRIQARPRSRRLSGRCVPNPPRAHTCRPPIRGNPCARSRVRRMHRLPAGVATSRRLTKGPLSATIHGQRRATTVRSGAA